MQTLRLDHDIPFGERILLHACWLVSGYGLRASRGQAALGVAMADAAAGVLDDGEDVQRGTVRVVAVKKPQARIARAWLRRNAAQL